MSKARVICRRCHRNKRLNARGYCAGCADTLDEKPRRPAAPTKEDEPAEEAPAEELGEATTDPAPSTPPQDRNTMPDAPQAAKPPAEPVEEKTDEAPDTPRSESLASEPPASGVKS